MNLRKRYVCVKQHDSKDCGAACLATIAKHFGLRLPISRIREAAGTDTRGTSAYGLIQAAQELGFTAKGVKGDQAAFFTPFPLPAIAHVVVDQALLHYVVIYKITKNQVVLADPARGMVTYTPEQFFSIWTGVLFLLTPASSFKKGNETKGLFSRFFHLIIPHKKLLLHICLASFLYSFLGIGGAFYVKYLLDEMIPYSLEQTLHLFSAGMVMLIIFKILLQAFRAHLILYVSQKLDIALMLGFYRHVLTLPMNFFGTRKTGEIISRFMDASKVREAISNASLSMLIDSVMAMAGGVILYMQNAFLFGITLIIVLFYALLVWLFHKPYDRLNRCQMEENAQLHANLVESIQGIETIKAYSAEYKTSLETEKKFIKLLKSILKFGFVSNVQASLQGFVSAAGGIVILWAGAGQVIQGNLTMGQLIAFNALLAYFLEPIQNLIHLQSSLQSAVVAADRLGEILDLQPERQAAEGKKAFPLSLQGAIHINAVHFRYGTRELTLKNIQISISAGEKVAFVGESGSGKTTLIKLLLKFYMPEKGDILINENNIQDINVDVLRGEMGFIPQQPSFFSGTIRDNLCLGVSDDIDLEAIIAAAKKAKAHDFINQLPLRYDTLLEEGASNLSGGQRQRLAIARALLKQPDILIMDEATSNLDSITEKAISEAIFDLHPITTLIIAHRLSTVIRCDRIYVMEKGEVVEYGSHHQLMERKEKYYHLWKDQWIHHDGTYVMEDKDLTTVAG